MKADCVGENIADVERAKTKWPRTSGRRGSKES